MTYITPKKKKSTLNLRFINHYLIEITHRNNKQCGVNMFEQVMKWLANKEKQPLSLMDCKELNDQAAVLKGVAQDLINEWQNWKIQVDRLPHGAHRGLLLRHGVRMRQVAARATRSYLNAKSAASKANADYLAAINSKKWDNVIKQVQGNAANI